MEGFVQFLPLVFRAINLRDKLMVMARLGTPIEKAVADLAGDLLSPLAVIGHEIFPDLADAKAAAAAVAVMFFPERTEWVQNGLNHLLSAGLTVNGIYDDKTKTVVGQFQKAHNLNVDGWAGDLTAAALQSDLLAKGFR